MPRKNKGMEILRKEFDVIAHKGDEEVATQAVAHIHRQDADIARYEKLTENLRDYFKVDAAVNFDISGDIIAKCQKVDTTWHDTLVATMADNEVYRRRANMYEAMKSERDAALIAYEIFKKESEREAFKMLTEIGFLKGRSLWDRIMWFFCG